MNVLLDLPRTVKRTTEMGAEMILTIILWEIILIVGAIAAYLEFDRIRFDAEQRILNYIQRNTPTSKLEEAYRACEPQMRQHHDAMMRWVYFFIIPVGATLAISVPLLLYVFFPVL